MSLAVIDMLFNRVASNLMRIRRWAANPSIAIPPNVITPVLAEYKVQPWFFYMLGERANRWDVWMPFAWLKKKLPHNSLILETGCGVGFNLFWLAERGFTKLNGFDIDGKAIEAGMKICGLTGLKISLWVDDGIAPLHMPQRIKYMAIVALNWTIYIQGFSLKAFLEYYSNLLDGKGMLVFDMIDSSYNSVENNEYLSTDWQKPRDLRLPSEYRVRMNSEEIEAAFTSSNFILIKKFSVPQVVPKAVYVVRKRDRNEEGN